MQDIFSNTLPIFLITLIGSFIRRKWITSEEFWRGLEKLSYFLLVPAVIFNHVSTVDLKLSMLKLIVGLILSTSIVAIGLIIYHKKNNTDKLLFTSIFQGGIRYNNYIFFGLSNALFGDKGLSMVAVISSYMIIFTNILSIVVFAQNISSESNNNRQLNNVLLLAKLLSSNPLIIASILGFIFNYLKIELNLGIKNTIATLSYSALAIGMLHVGAALKFTISSNNFKQVLFTSLVKLVILPIVAVIVLSLMSITGTEKSIGVLYSCLPCASSSYVLSRQLGGDSESMASIITFSTLLSVLSLSLLMYIVG